MNSILKILKKEPVEYTSIAMMSLFIESDMIVPKSIANIVDTLFGKILVIILALSLFFIHHILGGIALIFAYELIKRSEKSTGSFHKLNYLPSEYKKGQHFSALNQFPVSLEEEIVQKLVPISNKNLGEPTYKPILSKLHDSASLY